MSETYKNLSLTSKAFKVFIENGTINQELLKENVRLRKKMANFSKIVNKCPSTFNGYCLSCFAEMCDVRKCWFCQNWECKDCVASGEISPVIYSCVICHDTYCMKCSDCVPGQGVCEICKNFVCEFCHLNHVSKHHIKN